MMGAAKLRFGIVGAGAIGRDYGTAIAGSDEAEVVAVADSRFDAARELAERLGCEAYGSYAELGEKSGVEAVLVCTPPNSHPDISLHFIDSRVHVLCEKPFSIEARDAARVLKRAQEQGVKITMASKFRYVEDVIRAKQIVDSGILGEIILLENAFASRVDMSKRWNSDPAVSGGGVLIDNGTHSLDLMRYFLGPLAEVQVVEGKRSQGLAVEETVRIFVRSVEGVMGSIDLSWSLNKELDSYISVFGSRGTVHVGWKESKYRQSSSSDWVIFGRGYGKVAAFRRQVEHFARAIRGEEALLIKPQDALASVEVVAAAYESLRESHWRPIGCEVLT
jgi:predicted dehydrogenase